MNRIALAALALALAGCQAYLGRDDGKPGASPKAKESATPNVPAAAGAAPETGRAASEGGRAGEARSVPAPPAPAAAPTTPAKRIASGTALRLVLETTAASDKSRPGDVIVAKLAEDVKQGERVLLRAGTEVRGEVLAAEGSGRVKGRARLAVGFMKLVAGGQSYSIQTSAIDATAAPQKGRDAKIIGGGAVAGALIGAIAGGGGGAAKGAAIGGAAGGGTVLATKGKEVVFAAGSRHTVTLKTSVTLD